jgi:hypothetical protein
LESLTATHDGEGFRRIAQCGKFMLFHGERGPPVNVGGDLFANHQVSWRGDEDIMVTVLLTW